jgi:hypothetical protein
VEFPDYIFHEQNGLLIFATEENAIIAEGVSHIERLLNDVNLRKTLGSRARKDAIEKSAGILLNQLQANTGFLRQPWIKTQLHCCHIK